MNKIGEMALQSVTFLSNGSSCIPEFLFEVRFNFSSKKGH